MSYDYKNVRWQNDINAFGRWKFWVIRLKDRKDDFAVSHCETIRQRLHDIQQRWPQFIKVDEIP